MTVGSDNTSPAALTGVISGSGSLTKIGTGTLTLQGANTYSGATTINAGGITLNGTGGTATSTAFTVNSGGTLTLDNSANNNTARISSTSALTMNGGVFVFNGSNTASTNATESVGALTLSSGTSTVTVNSGTGGSTTLTFASVSRSAGATVLFRGPSFGSIPAINVSTIKFTTAPTLTGGGGSAGSNTVSILPYAIGDNSPTGSGTDFVTYNVGNTNGLRLLNGAGFSNEYATSVPTSVTTENVKITTTSSPSSSGTVNSIIFGNGGGLTPAGSVVLTVTSGAVMGLNTNSGITSSNSSSRQLAFGSVEGIIQAVGSLTIGVNVTGTSGITVAGGATLTLNDTNNTFTGAVTVDGGTLSDGASGILTTNNVTVNGTTAVFALGTSSESVGTVTVENGGSITGTTGVLTSNATYAMQSGTVSAILAGSVGLTKTTTGTVTLSGANTYTGTTTITQGTLSASSIVVSGSASNLGNATSAVVLGGTSTSGLLSYGGSSATYTRGFTVSTEAAK